MVNYIVCLCRGCDKCCAICMNCEAWSCRGSRMGSMSLSSCMNCMCVSYGRAYSRAGPMTAL